LSKGFVDFNVIQLHLLPVDHVHRSQELISWEFLVDLLEHGQDGRFLHFDLQEDQGRIDLVVFVSS
jgi:hypothetical protein